MSHKINIEHSSKSMHFMVKLGSERNIKQICHLVIKINSAKFKNSRCHFDHVYFYLKEGLLFNFNH